MARWVYNDGVEAVIRKRSNRAVEVAANTAAAILRENLSGAGTGIFWPGNRVPSSVPGEFPARQTGDLVGSIRVYRAGPATMAIAVGGEAEKIETLEFGSPEEGGRPFFSRTLEDPETFRAMNDAVLAAFGKSF